MSSEGMSAPPVDAFLITSILGMGSPHPWLPMPAPTPDSEDAFSLVVARSEALGFRGSGQASTSLWSVDDAGSVGREGGQEVLWFQISPVSRWDQSLPIWHATAVAADVLNRLGQFAVTGLHMILPLQCLSREVDRHPRSGAWFRAADPSGSSEAEIEVRVPASAAFEDEDLVAAVRRFAVDLPKTTIREGTMRSERISETALRGLQFLPEPTRTTRLHASTGPWSLDIATAIIEAVGSALAELGLARLCSVYVGVRDPDRR